jgi:hypothetical protein
MNKEISEVDYTNYYMFLGCSHSFGLGLPLRDTYVHKIAEYHKVDYINASIPATSPEYSLNTAIELLSTLPAPPKALIINWPSIYWTMYWNDQNHPIHCVPQLLRNVPPQFLASYKEFLKNDRNIINKFQRMRSAIKLLCHTMAIGLFEFTQDNSSTISNELNLPLLVDPGPDTDYNKYYARDIYPVNALANGFKGHWGTIHQDLVVTRFNQWLLTQ